jgi:hypothetical protein
VDTFDWCGGGGEVVLGGGERGGIDKSDSYKIFFRSVGIKENVVHGREAKDVSRP